MKFAIIYICTGRYSIFWDHFYQTAEQYFLPDAQKEYYVFTEDKKILEAAQRGVYPHYCKKMGWPYDVLQKWEHICGVQDLLSPYDYIVLCNANMEFLRPISKSEFGQGEFTVWTSSKDGDESENMPFERNANSAAYIPYGTKKEKYLSSRFIVGRAGAFLQMARTLRDWTAEDLRRGVIAVWHDESMENAYFYHHPEISLHYVGPSLIAVEELMAEGETTHAIFCNKDKYGGNVGVRYHPLLGKLDIFRRKAFHKIGKIFRK
ncbi:MAG: hypothetical protein Q4C60_01960 [Eubacteriales bacterium]|nr:hypothetical protein [Eubacteriales bacterium]